MRRYHLNFISDEDLYHHVKETVFKYRFSIDFEEFNENLIDPIKLTFDSAIYHGGYQNDILTKILENEIHRQIDRSNINHIGYFHQNIFKYIGKDDDWNVPKQGFDVENHKKLIYVEIKNKHNTMNARSSADTYMLMQDKVLNSPTATCMLVEVIAKNSQNIPWECTIRKVKLKHDNIRRVSIDKFYEIVTGQPDAFAKLCFILPKVIQDVLKNETMPLMKNTVFDEIRQQNIEHILTSLYLLAFKKYQGFDGFALELS